MRKYIVELTKSTRQVTTVYGRGYFPRGFHYKTEAVACKQNVAELGGAAVIKTVGEETK